ncbi:MAG: hypothetical protein CMO43_09025 [Verrucomicrobiales bacterium]|jgi:hypothetical protein|nr:hypothetical protein [Verrucomicrobiales bacterium]MDP6679758.1 hypothetical protein [Verrucomicrobiota bacterium]MDP6754295.1 hypothetical protein [Verrucomicrobiota bacterium]MDP7013664.1 hypothetical protein [Verrucomicrobiota bacterium]
MSKKKQLANEEWDFSVLEKAPRTLIHRALQWELDRELGSGREPFLKTAECRRALASGKGQGSASGVVELGKASDKTMPFEEPHNFRIDWSQPREELIDQFGQWLDTQEKSGRLIRKPTLGKPRQPLTMLRKMSIVRLKANGYSLRSATSNFTDKKRYVESLHKINWTTASREVTNAMTRRRGTLRSLERTMGGKNWKTGVYRGA